MKENTFANMEYVYEVYKEGSFSRAAANLTFRSLLLVQR